MDNMDKARLRELAQRLQRELGPLPCRFCQASLTEEAQDALREVLDDALELALHVLRLDKRSQL